MDRVWIASVNDFHAVQMILSRYEGCMAVKIAIRQISPIEAKYNLKYTATIRVYTVVCRSIRHVHVNPAPYIFVISQPKWLKCFGIQNFSSLSLVLSELQSF